MKWGVERLNICKRGVQLIRAMTFDLLSGHLRLEITMSRYGRPNAPKKPLQGKRSNQPVVAHTWVIIQSSYQRHALAQPCMMS